MREELDLIDRINLLLNEKDAVDLISIELSAYYKKRKKKKEVRINLKKYTR